MIIIFRISLLASFFLLFDDNPSFAQIAGCTDPLSNNFNPLATVNDGSCTYTVTNYTPPIKVDPINTVLVESSGLQMAGNYLWSFNDGGGAAAIYRLDTISNAILQKVNLSGAANIDWEDIGFDGVNLYVGDFGNNYNGARIDLKIYKFPLAAIPDYINNPEVTIPLGQIEIINFSYSDQPHPILPTSVNHTKFDCEAMIIDGGKIHLFTKNWLDLNTTHYQINSLTAGTYIATPLETLATNYLVTAADKTVGKKLIILMGYKNSGTGSHYLHLFTDYSGESYFNGNKRQIDLPDAIVMGQAEGISLRNDTYGYISDERFSRTVFGIDLVVNQKLRSFDVAAFVTDLKPVYTFTGNGNWNDVNNWDNHIFPPASINVGSEIIISPVQGGQCILNIPYTVTAGAKLTVSAAKSFIVKGNLKLN